MSSHSSFCPRCNQTISLPHPPPPSSPTLTARQELENKQTSTSTISSSPPLLPPSSSTVHQLAPFAPLLFPPDSQDTNDVNPIQRIQNYIQAMQQGGENIQFLTQNQNNPGDDFFDLGFEQWMQQLAENQTNRDRTTPAAKKVVQRLKNVKITQDIMGEEASKCAVCMEELQMGGEAKRIPCKHCFHEECILPWLDLYNSCPLCRYELPIDDSEYEQRARGNGGEEG